MAGPVRFRRSTEGWDEAQVRRELLSSLEDRFGARLVDPKIAPPREYTAARLEMDNGDLALFAWNGEGAYWLGNTETPEALWRTDKETFAEAPFPVARWAQRELLARLEREDPWLTEFRYLAWFFLPVFFSKDGRETTRRFFRDDAAGFPDATREEGLGFYDRFLKTGVLEPYRYTMASKLGTSEYSDLKRMRATMGEFDAAKLLADAGHAFVPEVEHDSGHALDFVVDDVLVEVTRPRPPRNRTAGTAVSALTRTAESKTGDQLAAHGDALLLVDCTSFRDEEWNPVGNERPALAHDPAVVFRYRPDGRCEGYRYGGAPLALRDGIEWI
ncbi:hypothetical protein BRC95_07935 [Halobacteriales archaeon QS_5_68_33]|nr:MAG: hypothetical protein BRC95_07935 [Halobacteriales archaeon QS_5_68_33]